MSVFTGAFACSSFQRFKSNWASQREPFGLFVFLRALRGFTDHALSHPVAFDGESFMEEDRFTSGEKWDRNSLLVDRSQEIFSCWHDKQGFLSLLKFEQNTTHHTLATKTCNAQGYAYGCLVIRGPRHQTKPSKAKCTAQGCGQYLQSNMRLCWNFGANKAFDEDQYDVHRIGNRNGWKANPKLELPPDENLAPREKALLSQVDDIWKEMKTWMKKDDDARAVESSEWAPSSRAEWDLNFPDDCLAYLEHFFPAAGAEALDINPDAFEKNSRFFIKHLQNRVPKAPLSVQLRNEIISPGVLKSKPKRRDWLQAFANTKANAVCTGTKEEQETLKTCDFRLAAFEGSAHSAPLRGPHGVPR